MDVEVAREMGMNHQEFFRILPLVVADRAYRVDGGTVTVSNLPGSLRIRLAPERIRVLGALNLPVTCMTFSFSNCSSQTVETFMQRFDRAFHRGGG